MNFWDSSAVLPIVLEELGTLAVQAVQREDPGVVIWWATSVECVSGICRLRREGIVDDRELRVVLSELEQLISETDEIEPSETVRTTARRLLCTHALRAADAFQLAAAIVWAGQPSANHGFVCLDQRLREAASIEGFHILPERLEGPVGEEQP